MSKGIEKIIEKTAERDERGRVTRIIERHVTPPPEAIALSANTVADLIVLRALETLADPAVPIKVGQPIVLNMPIRGATVAADAMATIEQTVAQRFSHSAAYRAIAAGLRGSTIEIRLSFPSDTPTQAVAAARTVGTATAPQSIGFRCEALTQRKET
jgi:hypothetical protein